MVFCSWFGLRWWWCCGNLIFSIYFKEWVMQSLEFTLHHLIMYHEFCSCAACWSRWWKHWWWRNALWVLNLIPFMGILYCIAFWNNLVAFHVCFEILFFFFCLLYAMRKSLLFSYWKILKVTPWVFTRLQIVAWVSNFDSQLCCFCSLF